MAEPRSYLVTGAGGGVAGISPQVVTQLLGRGEAVRAMVHRDDARADALRTSGYRSAGHAGDGNKGDD